MFTQTEMHGLSVLVQNHENNIKIWSLNILSELVWFHFSYHPVWERFPPFFVLPDTLLLITFTES